MRGVERGVESTSRRVSTTADTVATRAGEEGIGLTIGVNRAADAHEQ